MEVGPTRKDSPRAPRGVRRPPTARLRLEPLEDRLLMDAATANFVGHLYRQVLDREAQAGESQPWLDRLDAGEPRAQVVRDFLASPEARVRAVDRLYHSLLGRPLEEPARQTWLTAIAAGLSLDGVTANVLGSAEYYASAHVGGDDQRFLTAVYGDLIGRALDQDGRDSWTGHLARGESRVGVALLIMQTSESDLLGVNELYLRHLGRDGDAAGLADYVGQLQRGAADQEVEASILASAEFFALAQQAPAEPLDLMVTVPDSPAGLVSKTFTLSERAKAASEFGLYRIDDLSGRVGNLMPGDAGYVRAALSQPGRQLVFSAGDPVGLTRTVEVAGGSAWGYYLISDADHSVWHSSNRNDHRPDSARAFFSFSAANPDSRQHVQTSDGVELRWEDGLSGSDFDDLVINVSVPVAPAPVVPPPPSAVEDPVCELAGGLQGWTTAEQGGSEEGRGSVRTQDGGGAVLREGDSFEVSLERTFVVPGPRSVLAVALNNAFDVADPGPNNDAIEIALLDGEGASLVPTIAPGRDAFFSVTEWQTPVLSGGEFADGVLRLTLDGMAGTNARLVIRLVNHDSDTGSFAAIQCVTLTPALTSRHP